MVTESNLYPESKVTVVFVHGIIGSPVRFKDFYPHVPEGVSCIKVVLDGHGGTPKDFSKTRRIKWEEQIHSLLLELKEKGQKVFYVGHSMGCLFGLRESLNGLIDSLFLLNVPMKPKLGFMTIKECLKCAFGKPENYDFMTPIFLVNCSISMSKNPFVYLGWIPRFLDLFKEISLTKKILPSVTTENICYHSEKDELVRKSSLKVLKKGPQLDVEVLPGAGHYYLPEDCLSKVLTEFDQRLDKLLSKD